VDTATRCKRIARLAEAARRAQQAADDARAARDQELDAGEADGLAIREMARWANLAPISVLRILARQERQRQHRRRALTGPLPLIDGGGPL